MRTRAVTVAGGSVGGLAAALLLAGDGHHVTVVERDELHAGAAVDSPSWARKGIPHFLQPHAFIPRGRRELRDHLPDVYASLIAAGAHDVDLRGKLPGPVTDDDAELQYLAVRRPLIEWALRRAVASDDRIAVLDSAHVTGVHVTGGRISGIVVDGDVLDTDLLVDALGRRSAVPAWLAESGADAGTVESTDCGVVYYCRYYGLRDGFDLPDGRWLLSPRGDLGYLGYASFPGDNRTFAALLAAPTGVAEWRRLKDSNAFEAAVAEIPALRAWVDPDGVDPITPVMPMAGLRNSIRRYDPAVVPGWFPIGDALCHTDPVLAHGLAFALIHAAALAVALREHSELGDAGAAYAAAVTPALRERYRFASELDAQRHRMWMGEPVDFAHRAGDFALFSMVAAGAAAFVDADVFRTFVRRIGLLDSIDVFDNDEPMQHRVERLFAEMMASPRPAPGPDREAMVQLVAAAANTS